MRSSSMIQPLREAARSTRHKKVLRPSRLGDSQPDSFCAKLQVLAGSHRMDA